jgi:RHS repeat-associated protein
VHFKGRLLGEITQWGANYVIVDRLGSASGASGAYYPYGENAGGAPMEPGGEAFATYYEDWYGQNYADQRYYNSIGGRFLTPDPGGIRTAHLKDPVSWNRYAYANGDPVNRIDPSGKDSICVGWTDDQTCYDWWEPSGGGGGSGQNGIDPTVPIKSPPVPPSQAGRYIPAGLRTTVANAVGAAEQDLEDPDCASIFGPNIDPYLALANAWTNNDIRAATFDSGVNAAVGAATISGVIYIATNRYFFTGIQANGASAMGPGTVFDGMTMQQMQQAILIHELLHLTGVVGSDNANQTVTLGNGEVVTGSAGVTAAVRQHCFK